MLRFFRIFAGSQGLHVVHAVTHAPWFENRKEQKSERRLNFVSLTLLITMSKGIRAVQLLLILFASSWEK